MLIGKNIAFSSSFLIKSFYFSISPTDIATRTAPDKTKDGVIENVLFTIFKDLKFFLSSIYSECSYVRISYCRYTPFPADTVQSSTLTQWSSEASI